MKNSIINYTLVALLTCAFSFTQQALNAQEDVVSVDYSADRAHDSSYAFGGYGLEGDTENYNAGDGFKSTLNVSNDKGNPGQCITATLDSSKSEIPSDNSYSYVGWGAGSGIDLAKAWKDQDLSNYTVSFDGKISGTDSLSSSKLFVNFVVDDDKVAKDDDEHDDIVLRLAQGEEDGTNAFTLTKEYKTFTFELKDMVVENGNAVRFDEFDVKRIAFTVQAQGSAEDIGKDNDNVLYVDNFKLTKKK